MALQSGETIWPNRAGLSCSLGLGGPSCVCPEQLGNVVLCTTWQVLVPAYNGIVAFLQMQDNILMQCHKWQKKTNKLMYFDVRPCVAPEMCSKYIFVQCCKEVGTCMLLRIDAISLKIAKPRDT